MSGCEECGAYDLDWWTEDGERIILCEVCGWSETEPIEEEGETA